MSSKAEAVVANPSPYTNDTVQRLLGRVSVRSFRPDPVPDEMIDAILAAAMRAPTSSNIQAYSVVVVRDPGTKADLAVATGNQAHVAQCPVFLAFCADLTRIEHAALARGSDLEDNNLELGLVSSVDATLLGMSAYLVAETLGLDGLMIGGVRNDPERIGELLGLPPRVYCVFGMCLGYAATIPEQKPRMALDAIVHRERYDREKMAAHIASYDDALAAHYRRDDRATTDDSWSHDVAAKFSARPRDGLRAALGRMGFDWS